MVWAPICGTVAWANGQLQPGAAVKAWLAKHDLLDVPAHQFEQQQAAELLKQQQAAAAAQQLEQQQQQQEVPKVPVTFEDMPWRDKIRAVEAIKRREIEQLHAQLRSGEKQAAAAAGKEQQQQQDAAPRRRWWLW